MIFSIILILITTFASQTWIQAVHITKNNKDTQLLQGVSLIGLLTTVISETLWITYTLHFHLIGGLTNALLSLCSVFVICVVLTKNNLIKHTTVVIYVICIALSLILLQLIPIKMITVCAMVVATMFLIPQTIKTVKSIGTSHITAMSNYSIIMIIVANTIWIIYGIYYFAYAYLISSSVLLLCGIIMGLSKLYDKKKYKNFYQSVNQADD